MQQLIESSAKSRLFAPSSSFFFFFFFFFLDKMFHMIVNCEIQLKRYILAHLSRMLTDELTGTVFRCSKFSAYLTVLWCTKFSSNLTELRIGRHPAYVRRGPEIPLTEMSAKNKLFL